MKKETQQPEPIIPIDQWLSNVIRNYKADKPIYILLEVGNGGKVTLHSASTDKSLSMDLMRLKVRPSYVG